MAGYSFAGMDPTGKITGLKALGNLTTTLGRNLTGDEKTRAMGFAGYGDLSGGTDMTGTQYNRLMEEAAKATGGTYTPWTAPTGGASGTTSGSTATRLNMAPLAPAPTLNLPGYQAPQAFTHADYQAPQAFTYADYQGPAAFSFSGDDLYTDPSYEFVRNQGQRGLERSAAARGMLRTGNTLQGVVDYNQAAASREYQAAYGRAADTYDRNTAEGRYAYQTNRGNAADTYDRNYRVGRDAYDVNRANAADQWTKNAETGRYAHEQATNKAAAEYVPRLSEWTRQADRDEETAKYEFDRQWQQDLYGRDDAWRRHVYANDDNFRRFQVDEERRRFLASLGAQ
jgi:hypothetical protein